MGFLKEHLLSETKPQKSTWCHHLLQRVNARILNEGKGFSFIDLFSPFVQRLAIYGVGDK